MDSSNNKDATNEMKAAKAPAGMQPPPAKKPRSTIDLRNPTIANFQQIWLDSPFFRGVVDNGR